jgi:formylglycine-generating enzyme required for sulfatase activity
MGYADRDMISYGQNRATMTSIDSFYMMESEVSNLDYLSFLKSLDQTDSILMKTLLPDTLVWREKGSYNEPYTQYYLRHPAYNKYPVVGVSYNQAIAFANWMTEKYNSQLDEEKEFKKVKFRLPTEEEWEYAARGGLEISAFPWGGPYMRNADGQRMANMLYLSQSSLYRDTIWIENYLSEGNSTQPKYVPKERFLSTGASDYMGVAGNLSDGADVTAPVHSYWPNGYGLYNMTGNVEEMVDAYYNREDTLHQYSASENSVKSEDPSGVTRGGSWRDTGYYGMVSIRQFYQGKDSVSSEIGFRLVMDVVEY